MKKLFDILENPRDKLIAVDLDGTLCHGEFWGDDEPEPHKEMIDYFNSLYKKGAHIIIYTARQPKWFSLTMSWLIKNEVMYHGITMMQKPGADLYIDDKVINIKQLDL